MVLLTVLPSTRALVTKPNVTTRFVWLTGAAPLPLSTSTWVPVWASVTSKSLTMFADPTAALLGPYQYQLPAVSAPLPSKYNCWPAVPASW